jgi:hypothetical protein
MTKLSLFHTQNQKIIAEHMDELQIENTDWQAAAEAVSQLKSHYSKKIEGRGRNSPDPTKVNLPDAGHVRRHPQHV